MVNPPEAGEIHHRIDTYMRPTEDKQFPYDPKNLDNKIYPGSRVPDSQGLNRDVRQI